MQAVLDSLYFLVFCYIWMTPLHKGRYIMEKRKTKTIIFTSLRPMQVDSAIECNYSEAKVLRDARSRVGRDVRQ